MRILFPIQWIFQNPRGPESDFLLIMYQQYNGWDYSDFFELNELILQEWNGSQRSD